jgi:hypothetical protein
LSTSRDKGETTISAYSRGDLAPAAYFERILSALVRKAGGEIRVPGELVDRINEATTVAFFWDRKKQEVVIRGAVEDELLIDIFRVTPENAQPKLPAPRLVDPLEKTLFRENVRSAQPPPPQYIDRNNNNPMDDEAVKRAENAKALRMAKMLVKRMLQERQINAG